MSIRAIKPNKRKSATASCHGAKATPRPVSVAVRKGMGTVIVQKANQTVAPPVSVGVRKGMGTVIVQKGKQTFAPPWAAFQPTMNIDSIHERVEKRIAINRKKEA